MPHKQRIDLGEARIQPDGPQAAGSWTTITLTYTAGHPMDDTGCLKIAFRFASDFGTPQFTDPAAPHYVTVATTANCVLEPRWDPKGHTRPWGKALLLKVMRGYVDRGDTITVVFGDRSGGSRGWRLPTFCESTFEFKTLVDPVATYQFKELTPSPTLAIVPGEAARAVCVAPSQVTVGCGFSYYLKVEDRWGNPLTDAETLRHPGFDAAGITTLAATDEASGLSATSNPIRVVEAISDEAILKAYWGDLHGQSEETIGTNTVGEYFDFARNRGLVDVASHQGNDFQITEDFWELINETTVEINESGRFVAFPGWEWSGNTPLGGDRNVFFEEEGGPIYRSCFDLLPDQEAVDPQAGTAAELFAMLRENDAQRPWCYAHVGGRYADIRMHDESLEIAVEVHSAWGTFEWLVDDAFALGYRVGIVANSDGHKGRPGASYPGASRFGSLGGLTCILASELNRPAIVEALRARNCFGTTGHRPLIDLNLQTDTGEAAIMGDIVQTGAGSAALVIRTIGTAPIQAIQIRNGQETLTSYRPYTTADLGRFVQVVWSGAEVRGRARHVAWDGHITVSGTTIAAITPINFWNADQQPQQVSAQRVEFQSITTGGLSGLLLELDDAGVGELQIETAQGRCVIDISELGVEPLVREYGGLAKELRVSRLPESLPTDVELDVEIALSDGDNPIYIRVDQVDGHMAWTSPIYLVRSGD